MRKVIHDNGLSIVFGVLFVVFLLAQTLTGHAEYNHEQEDHNQPTLSYREYVVSSHSMEATMENWESEFLQMAMYVLLTVFLFQRGSSESKDPDKEEEVDQDPRAEAGRKDAPGPVKRGGWMLRLYENSLGMAFVVLFLITFTLHAMGGAKLYSEEQVQHGGASVSTFEFLQTSQFWFESFQNWQSEFLSVLSMVVLSIFLRQKGSPESKPVAAAHADTGS